MRLMQLVTESKLMTEIQRMTDQNGAVVNASEPGFFSEFLGVLTVVAVLAVYFWMVDRRRA